VDCRQSSSCAPAGPVVVPALLVNRHRCPQPLTAPVEVSARVEGTAVAVGDLEVEGRPGGPAGGPGAADELARLHDLAVRHEGGRQMRVPAPGAVRMLEDHGRAVAALCAAEDHAPAGGRTDLLPVGGAQVDPLVEP